MNNENEDLTNKEINGQYYVLKKIGSGSFGQVYVGRLVIIYQPSRKQTLIRRNTSNQRKWNCSQ